MGGVPTRLAKWIMIYGKLAEIAVAAKIVH